MSDSSTLPSDRLCKICKVRKPIEDFRKDYRRFHKNYCHACYKKSARKYWHDNAKRLLANGEVWRKANMENVAANARARYARPEVRMKHKARYAVKKAVLAGVLNKQPCDTCGNEKVHFHHTNGYDEANYLVGRWLCPAHHAALHKELRWKTI